jgi:hypothetical protein
VGRDLFSGHDESPLGKETDALLNSSQKQR